MRLSMVRQAEASSPQPQRQKLTELHPLWGSTETFSAEKHSILSKEKLIFSPQNKNNEITVFYPENVNGKFVPSYEYRLEIFGFQRKGRSSHFHSVKNEANRVHISLWSNDWFFFLCLIHTALNMYREQTYTLDKAHRLH